MKNLERIKFKVDINNHPIDNIPIQTVDENCRIILKITNPFTPKEPYMVLQEVKKELGDLYENFPEDLEVA